MVMGVVTGVVIGEIIWKSESVFFAVCSCVQVAHTHHTPHKHTFLSQQTIIPEVITCFIG